VDLFAYIGETLRRLRKERDKTLEELSQEAGIGRGQLSRIENARQEATLSTLSKILASQGVSRREFFSRYELVEAEAEAVERSGLTFDGADGEDAWPEEVRRAVLQIRTFVSSAFLQPKPAAQGSIELGDLVILFRVVAKAKLPEPGEGSGEALPGAVPRSRSRSARRPPRRAKPR
jgi:transcriptional regulator with XRE-family HTH domain